MKDACVVEKILCLLQKKINYIVFVIEELQNIEVLLI